MPTYGSAKFGKGKSQYCECQYNFTCGVCLGEPTHVPCLWCREQTRSTGTKMCDKCWELHSRIASDPALATRILESLGYDIQSINQKAKEIKDV
jgi:hypothetical protein